MHGPFTAHARPIHSEFTAVHSHFTAQALDYVAKLQGGFMLFTIFYALISSELAVN